MADPVPRICVEQFDLARDQRDRRSSERRGVRALLQRKEVVLHVLGWRAVSWDRASRL